MNIIEKQTSNTCPTCRGNNLVWDPVTGEIVCKKCGLVVISTSINVGPERLAFTKSEEASRKRVGLRARKEFKKRAYPELVLRRNLVVVWLICLNRLLDCIPLHTCLMRR